jgi:hypothetical protein
MRILFSSSMHMAIDLGSMIRSESAPAGTHPYTDEPEHIKQRDNPATPRGGPKQTGDE